MSSVDVVNTLDGYGRLGIMKAVPHFGPGEKGEVRADPKDGLRYRFDGCEWHKLPVTRNRNGCLLQWDGSSWLPVRRR